MGVCVRRADCKIIFYSPIPIVLKRLGGSVQAVRLALGLGDRVPACARSLVCLLSGRNWKGMPCSGPELVGDYGWEVQFRLYERCTIYYSLVLGDFRRVGCCCDTQTLRSNKHDMFFA